MKNKVLLIILFLIFMQKACFSAGSEAQEAERLFLKGDFENAASVYEKELSQNLDQKQKDANIYMLSICYLKLKKAQEANNLLSGLLAKSLNKDFEADIKMAYADSFLAMDRPAEAYSEYDKILQTDAGSRIASLLNFKLGETERKLGQWDKAKAFYNKVVMQYPQSFEAKLAQDILANGEFYFSVQVGSYSKLENAQELTNELSQKGYAVYIVGYEQDGMRFNRVRVGKCSTKDEVAVLESSLKNEGLPTKIFP